MAIEFALAVICVAVTTSLVGIRCQKLERRVEELEKRAKKKLSVPVGWTIYEAIRRGAGDFKGLDSPPPED